MPAFVTREEFDTRVGVLEREVEAVLEGMSGDAAEPFREAFGVTEVAAARDLRAAGDGIPGRVRPFNLSGC